MRKYKHLLPQEEEGSVDVKRLKPGPHAEELPMNRHPLLNSVVMDRVMHFLEPSFQDIKEYRTVCKTWFDVTLDKWRKSATPKLMKSESLRAKEGSGVAITQFLSHQRSNCFLQLEKKPYKRLKMKGLMFTRKFGETPEFRELWDVIGVHIEYLCFERCSFREPKNKPGAFQAIIFEKVPNLKELVLDNNIVSYTASCREINVTPHQHLRTLQIEGKLPSRLQLLLPNLPAIENLCIRNGNEEPYARSTFISSILPAFRDLQENNPPHLNIKHLDVLQTNFFKSCQTTQFYKKALADLKLPLESLYIDVERRSEWRELISTRELLDVILNGFSSTLRVLKLVRRPWAPPFGSFPFNAQMDMMTELYLWGNVTDNFCFLKNMPNLRKLYINTCCVDKWKDFKDEIRCSCSPKLLTGFRYDMVRLSLGRTDMSAVKMTSLEFLHTTAYFLLRNDIRVLAEWMPNLKILKMAINRNDVFSEVCLRWPKLRELELLLESHVDDIAITGRRKYSRNRIPCLKDLKDLKKFGVEFLCDCALTLFTDRAVFDGFLLMENLDSLSITAHWRMSEKAESDLRKKIPHVDIYRVKRERRSDLKICEHLKFWEEMWLGWSFLDAAEDDNLLLPA